MRPFLIADQVIEAGSAGGSRELPLAAELRVCASGSAIIRMVARFWRRCGTALGTAVPRNAVRGQ